MNTTTAELYEVFTSGLGELLNRPENQLVAWAIYAMAAYTTWSASSRKYLENVASLRAESDPRFTVWAPASRGGQLAGIADIDHAFDTILERVKLDYSGNPKAREVFDIPIGKTRETLILPWLRGHFAAAYTLRASVHHEPEILLYAADLFIRGETQRTYPGPINRDEAVRETQRILKKYGYTADLDSAQGYTAALRGCLHGSTMQRLAKRCASLVDELSSEAMRDAGYVMQEEEHDAEIAQRRRAWEAAERVAEEARAAEQAKRLAAEQARIFEETRSAKYYSEKGTRGPVRVTPPWERRGIPGDDEFRATAYAAGYDEASSFDTGFDVVARRIPRRGSVLHCRDEFVPQNFDDPAWVRATGR